jgi:hypothetical protein
MMMTVTLAMGVGVAGSVEGDTKMHFHVQD